MRNLSAKHRIYLLYRQSQVEESMVSFIRNKLVRKGCSVIQDVTQSTIVLVLLTPGVFEFIDIPDDKVRNELVYVLRRNDEYRVLGIYCDLFVWPDSVHLPEGILPLKSCDIIEWSLENRDAFMTCLLDRIDPSLLNVMSCPTSPEIIDKEEHEEATGNGGEGSNRVSTRARDEEGAAGGLRRTGSAFYFDELNEHVERKSKVPAGRKRKPKILEPQGSQNEQGRLEETSDDTDLEEDHSMGVYEPPEHSDRFDSSSETRAYKPPDIPRDDDHSHAQSDVKERDVAHGAPINSGNELDTHVRSKHPENGIDTYKPPELPLEVNVQANVVLRKDQTPPPGDRTATIKPRNGDRVSVYVPPPSPPPLESLQNGTDGTDSRKRSSRRSDETELRSGTTTVVIDQRSGVSSEPNPSPENDRDRGDQVAVRPAPAVRRDPERRPQSQPSKGLERGVDAVLPQPRRQQGFTASSGRGSPISTSGKKAEEKSSIASFLRRKSFTLPKDSEIRYGRYADEHPFWNSGTYRKYDLTDEFCDESYFANKRNTLPRASFRLPRRNSSRRRTSERQHEADSRPVRAASVVVLDETEVHRFVPEIEALSDEPSEEFEARKRDAGSTPKGGRKTYEPVEEYRPPAEPEIVEDSFVVIEHDSIQTLDSYEPPSVPPGNGQPPAVEENSSVSDAVGECGPPAGPEILAEPLVGKESTSTHDVAVHSPTEFTVNTVKVPKSPDVPDYSPPPYELGLPDYILLPSPQKYIQLNHEKSKLVETAPLEETEPFVEPETYKQQLILPRRFSPLSEASEVRINVPDVRIAAQWTQVEVDEPRRQTLPSRDNEVTASAHDDAEAYRPPPLPTTHAGAEPGGRPQAQKAPIPAARKIQTNTATKAVRSVPAVIRQYKRPESPVDTVRRSEPIAYRKPAIDIEIKHEPLIQRGHEENIEYRGEPQAYNEAKTDIEMKSEPTAHRELKVRTEQIQTATQEAQGPYRPPSLPRDDENSALGRTQDRTVVQKTDPAVFKELRSYIESEGEARIITRRADPVLRTTAPDPDTLDGASFSKQNTTTKPFPNDSTKTTTAYVEGAQLARPIILKRSPHVDEEIPTPLTPPNSYSETTIHENIRRLEPPIYCEPPVVEESMVVHRKPAIPIEFSQSQFSPEFAYQPPPMPTAPAPRVDDSVRGNSAHDQIQQRTTEPIAYRTPPGTTRSSSQITGQAAYSPPPVPFNDEIEDKDRHASLPATECKTLPVPKERNFAPHSTRDSGPIYVPRQLSEDGGNYEERIGTPVAVIRTSPSPNQHNSNDGDDEGEEQESRKVRHSVHRSLKHPEVQHRETKPVIDTNYVPSDRRTRSVIEVSHSTMEPVLRRRVNSLDPRLTRDLREYVENHVCDRKCCKIVCPRRLAENIDNLHYADDVRILTNLDVLGRRRLSFLLAVEAQRYVSYLDSKFISCAGRDEGSKTPDSGCDPNSKVSDAESDATLSDNELVSEEVVARELEKIERMRQRNALLPEGRVIPPPYGYNSAERHQVYRSLDGKKIKGERTPDAYREPELPTANTRRSQTANEPPRRPDETSDVRIDGVIRAASQKESPNTTYRRPVLPTGAVSSDQNTYRAPELPSGYESPNEIPSNPAAREAMKQIIEGSVVFEPHIRKKKPSQIQRENDAKEAYDTWQSIWKTAERGEKPALTVDEIVSLFGVMRYILGTKSSLQEVRDDLRTIIQKNGMGLRR